MKCLYCGKEMVEPSDQEARSCWHQHCVLRFFGTAAYPELYLDPSALEEQANRAVSRGLTVPGVQKKISLHLSQEGAGRLTVVDYPTGFILKPATAEYRGLPEAEDLAMRIAEHAGIRTVPHALMKLPDLGYAYITRRVDRLFPKQQKKRKTAAGTQSQELSREPGRLAMEDFCQLSFRLTEDKYKGSYERCAAVIRKYSSQPGLDLAEFYLRLLISFLCGNSDMHLKNFSLIEKEPGSREYQLSPAYDLLPVNLILPSDRDQTALTLHGKKRNLQRKDFLYLAEHAGIPEKAADHMIRRTVSRLEDYIELTGDSLLPENMRQEMCGLIRERGGVLMG